MRSIHSTQPCESEGATKGFGGLLCFALILALPTVALADASSRNAVKASPSQLQALGLTKPDNTPFVPTGAGVRIGIAEAENGIPQLSDTAPVPNTFMPSSGPAAGANGQITILPKATDTLSSHATAVAAAIMERQDGVARSAGVFAAGANSYSQLMLDSQAMLATPTDGRGASILNWSWSSSQGSFSANGTSTQTRWADWASITQAGHPLQDKVIVIAGNEDPANGRLTPWDNFNGITVGATTGPSFLQLASYNGLAGTRNLTTDTSPYGNGRTGRFKTDLVAPGFGDGTLMLAPVVVGSADYDNFGPPETDNNGLNSNPSYGGTSFAAPHVTGAAALLEEYGSVSGFSTDHRVIKALLLDGANNDGLKDHNGAWKAEGLLSQKKNGQDVYVGWDGDLGTGLLDVSASLLNYKPGEKNPGNVGKIGWDMQDITAGSFNEYVLGEEICSIRATLVWDRQVILADSAGKARPNALWRDDDPATAGADPDQFFVATLNDLDLEIWDLTQNERVFFSSSDMDSIEYVDYLVPSDRYEHLFAIRTRYFNQFSGTGPETYALAWRTGVPEPGSLWLAALALLMLPLASRQPLRDFCRRAR